MHKVQNRYPESDSQVIERATRAQFDLVQKYRNSQQSVLHLIVTHGTLVRMFSQAAGMRKKKIKFCGMTAMGI